MDKEEFLKLDNQLCFALYSASRAIIRAYAPLLNRLGVTYTQYIVLLVLWEQNDISFSKLSERLNLDSGTLTPVLKKMEQQGLIKRNRSKEDERQIQICLTKKGLELKNQALEIPEQMLCKIPFSLDEAVVLKNTLEKLYK